MMTFTNCGLQTPSKPLLNMPPPPEEALLPLKVTLIIMGLLVPPYPLLYMPPPYA